MRPSRLSPSRLPRQEQTYLPNLRLHLRAKRSCRRRCGRSFVISNPLRRAGHRLPSATKPQEGRTKRVSGKNGGVKNQSIFPGFSLQLRLLSVVDDAKRIQTCMTSGCTNGNRNRRKIRLSKGVLVRFHLFISLAVLHEEISQLLHVRLSVGQS